MNCLTAPFEKHGFANQVHEWAERYYSTRSHDCPLFQSFYPALCEDFDECMAARGTVDHMRDTFQRASRSPVYHQKGPRIRLSRWSSWSHAVEWWADKKTCLLLVLVYMGVCKNWWVSAEALPCLGSVAFHAAQVADEHADEVADVPGAASSSGMNLGAVGLTQRA
eukprot:3986675-Amphidinium_carterae.1